MPGSALGEDARVMSEPFDGERAGGEYARALTANWTTSRSWRRSTDARQAAQKRSSGIMSRRSNGIGWSHDWQVP